jgi:hypothetical protein
MNAEDASEVAKSHFPLASLLEEYGGQSVESLPSLSCQTKDDIELYNAAMMRLGQMMRAFEFLRVRERG